MPTILGFSAFSSPSRTGVKTYRVPGTQVNIPVKAEVAPILIGFALEFHRTVEPLVRGWCWGYAYRAIRGLIGIPSKHSAAIAIDLNAPRHPLGRRGTFNAKQVRQIRALCRKYGLKWGGDWRRADEMHFELVESRAQALARVRRLQTPVARPAAKPTPAPAAKQPGPTLRRGDKGAHVVRWQNGLKRTISSGLRADGDFGQGTHSATVEFQRRCKLTPDGVVGPNTWREMFRRVPSL